MFWEKLALFFIVIFAIVGASFTAIITHEYTHYNDFKDYNITDQRLCGFVLPTGPHIANWTDYIWSAAGYYNFQYEETNMSAEELASIKQTDSVTEVHAYTVGAIIFVFFLICYMIITFSRYKDKRKIMEYSIQNESYKNYIKDLERYVDEVERDVAGL